MEGDDLEPWGFSDIPPVLSPWTITIPQGSTITVTIGVSGHTTAGDHHLIIEGSDPPIDVQLAQGEELGTKDLTFNEAGTFKVYSENLPDELHGTIVVTPGEGEAPVVEEPATTTGGPTAVPHTLEGEREDCLQCHGEDKFKAFPADHAGRGNDTCTTCHQPVE